MVKVDKNFKVQNVNDMKKFTITEFRAKYPNNDACLDKIFQLRYKNLVCPKCENDKPFTRVKNRRSYQCPSCGFQVYPTKDTVFEKTTTPLTYWFYAIFLQTTTRNGVAAKELERQLHICYHTALRMSHQIKKLMADVNTQPLKGIVEADETVLGMSISNMHTYKRKELSGHKDALTNKTIVLGMVERDGRIITKIIDKASKEVVEPIVRQNLEYASTLVTDSAKIYQGLNDDYYHNTVNHQMNEFVRGKYHTNTVEGFWSQLKRTIKGTHIHVSNKHLPKYMDEVAFRWMNKDKQDQMFELILSRIAS